jgi:hypothetical protein
VAPYNCLWSINTRLKVLFWEELKSIGNNITDAWLICGDFNSIRFRNERSGSIFSHKISKKFNAFLDNYSLIEFVLAGRVYTWSNDRSYALLDRFFCSLSWDNIYPHCMVKDLSRYGSDHYPIILCSQDNFVKIAFIFRFDQEWTLNLEFNRLLVKWWNEFPLQGNIIVYWH